MKKQTTNIESTPLSVLSHTGVELLNCGATRNTGFALASFTEDEVYEDSNAKFYYIFVVLKGSIKLSCKLYLNKAIKQDTMVFVPKDSFFKFKAESDTDVLAFAFTTSIIRTNKDILHYFCTEARKFKYVFSTLGLCDEMHQLVNMIVTQLASGKMLSEEICDAWNTLFFNTIQTFYNRSQVVTFLRPLFSSSISFVTFIENNYIESRGNVSYLIEISGIPAARFHSLFFEKFGMTAKAWLDTKAKTRILSMCENDHITVTDMAKVFQISTQQFCALCRRLFDCTPRELIASEQKKKSGLNSD